MSGLPDLDIGLDEEHEDTQDFLRVLGFAPATAEPEYEAHPIAERWPLLYHAEHNAVDRVSILASGELAETALVVGTKGVNLDAFEHPVDRQPEPTSSQLLAQAKERIDTIIFRLGRAFVGALLPVADKLTRAKALYEDETGTGHGKRNPGGWKSFDEVAAEALDRSPSFVERLLKLAQLDQETRELVAEVPKLVSNQDALLALAREPIPERRHAAVEEFKVGGRSAFDRALDRPLIEPPAQESINQASVLNFLTSYNESKQVEDEPFGYELEPKSLKQRKANAKQVFEYLADGETKLDAAGLERVGLTKAACNRAVKDLTYSGMIQSSGYLDDTFDVVNDKDITNLEIEPRRKPSENRTLAQWACTTGSKISGCVARIRDEVETVRRLLAELDARVPGHTEVTDHERRFFDSTMTAYDEFVGGGSKLSEDVMDSSAPPPPALPTDPTERLLAEMGLDVSPLA